MPPIIIGIRNSKDGEEFKDPMGLYGGGGLNPKPAETQTSSADTWADAGKPAKTETVKVEPADRSRLPAGMRNNNPGNIKFIRTGAFKGVVGPSENTDQGDPQAVFETPEAGMTAMYSLAKRKYDGGKKTPNQIIAGNMGWTPGNYDAAANVAKTMGVSPDDDINLDDPAMATKFMRALMLQEHGRASQAYTDDMITAAIGAGRGGEDTEGGIRVDDRFKLKDDLGFYEGENPFAAVDKGAAARDTANTDDPSAASAFLQTRLRGHSAEHITGMVPELQTGLAAMFQAAPPEIAEGLEIFSGTRTVQRQKELWDAALQKYGSVAEARKWVAPPPGEHGSKGSRHNDGKAGDLGWRGQRLDKAPAEVRDWLHQNAGTFGLSFPLSNEAWHVETADARGGKAAAPTSAVKPESGGIVINGDFQPKDDMKLLGDANPLRPAASEVQLRPFQPGEERPNADGSYSTEVSTTWQLPSGEWVNVPSLWMGPKGPVQFDAGDEESILDTMQAYEQANGQTFERFKSPEEAEVAAKARSAAGGAGALDSENQVVDQTHAGLDAQEPGKYLTMSEAEYDAWKAEWEKENRSTGRAGDLARKVGAGNADLGRTVRSVVGMIPKVGPSIVSGLDAVDQWVTGKPVEQRLRDYATTARVSVTDAGKVSYNKTWWNAENGTLGPAWADPDSYLGAIAESAPSTLATMGPSALLARGAYTAAIVGGLGEKAAAATAAKTALIAGAVGEGALGGGQSAIEVRDRINQIPRDQLLEADSVKALTSQGMTPDEAIASITDDAASQAFVVAGITTGAFGGLGDRALAKIIAEGVGGTVAKRILVGAGRGAAGEGIFEELPQSASQKVAENAAVQTVDPNQDLTEGVAEAAAGGLATGTAMGGGLGGAGGAISPAATTEIADQVEAPVITPPGTVTTEQAPPAGARRAGPLARALEHGETQAVRQQQEQSIGAQVAAAAAASSGIRPAPGATVRVDAEGIEPFMATVDSYEGDEAVVTDSGTGEVYQIPLGQLKQIAKPPEGSLLRTRDALPESSDDEALRPQEPIAGEITSELPPRDEQAPALEKLPSAPRPGQRVIVDTPELGRFAAKVGSYEEGATEVLITNDAGESYQVPADRLFVSKLTPKQVEEQDLKRNPPVERDTPALTGTDRRIGDKTIAMPDELHSRLYDLGKERLTSKRLMGTTNLGMDDALPSEQRNLAKEFGVDSQALGQMADDYRYRVERAAKEARSKLPVKMPPINDKRLKDWQAEHRRAGAIDEPVEKVPAQKLEAGATEVGADGLQLLHGGSPTLTLDAIEIIRESGQKQGKAGRTFGGFYGTSVADRAQAADYAQANKGKLFDVTVKPGTKILNKEGDITRLSKADITTWVEQGYGLVVGRDPRGRAEYVVIDKNAIGALNDSRSNSAPSNLQAKAWWDGMSPEDRRGVLDTAGVKRSEKVDWAGHTSGVKAKLKAAYLSAGAIAKKKSKTDVDDTENGVDLFDATPSSREKLQTRDDGNTGASGVAASKAEMLEPELPGLPSVRRGGNNSSSRMGQQFPRVLSGDRAETDADSLGGSDRRDEGVPTGQRKVGDPDGAVSEQTGVRGEPGRKDGGRGVAGQRDRRIDDLREAGSGDGLEGGSDDAAPDRGIATAAGDASGRDAVSQGVGSPARDKPDDASGPTGQGVAPGEGVDAGSKVDAAAHEAATSPLNDLPEPTEAQKQANNYKVGHLRLGGLDISIENPAGSSRSGTDKSGKPWSVEMKSHYGYVRGTVGVDGDHIDVFVNPGPEQDIDDDSSVYVVDQVDPQTGKLDEHKVMIGYESERDAQDGYLENYTQGWKGLGEITGTTLGALKAWLKDGDTTKGFAPEISAKEESVSGNTADESAGSPIPSANIVFTEDAAEKARALLRKKLGVSEAATTEPPPYAPPTVPEKAYHGTSSGGFATFDTYGGKYGLFGMGGYFTEDPAIAAEYTQKGKGAAPTVYQASLALKNPLDMDGPADLAAWEKAFPDYLDAAVFSKPVTNEKAYREVEENLEQEMIPDYEGAEVMQQGILAMGHDAITHIGGGRHKASKGVKHRVWIVFDPDQVTDLHVMKQGDDNEYSVDPDAPAGWGTADTGTDTGLGSAQDIAEVNDIIRKVAGLSDVMWMKRIDLPNGAPAWGTTTPTTAGGFYSPGQDIIAIAENTASATNAYHEAFHRLQHLFLSRSEKAVLAAEIGRLRRMVQQRIGREKQAAKMSAHEVEAEAFAAYSTGVSTIQPHKAFRAAWDRILKAIRQVQNFMRGRGFQTAEDVFDRAKSGEVANRSGKEKVKLVEDDKAFARWFKSSKVVDGSGKPLVVYHGTDSPIKAFDPAQLGSGTEAPSARMGFFFASDPAVASSYAQAFNGYRDSKIGRVLMKITGGLYERFNEAIVRPLGMSVNRGGENVVPVFLSIQNPAEFDFNGSEYRERTYASIIAQAKADGKDGVILRNTVDPGYGEDGDGVTDVYVVFEPTQIKSQFNRGSFDPTDPRISYRADIAASDDLEYSITEDDLNGTPVLVDENRIISEIKGKFSDFTPVLLKTVPFNYFSELKRPNMTAIDDYLRVKRALDAYRGKKHDEAAKTLEDWRKFIRLGLLGRDKSRADQLAGLMHEATLAGIDPSKTDAETVAKPGYDQLRKKFMAMPPAGRDVFAKARDAYKAQAEELDKILLDNVRKSQQVALDRADAEYDQKLEALQKNRSMSAGERKNAEKELSEKHRSDRTRAQWSMKARLTKMRIAFESNRVQEPYFPLARFGQYFVSVKDVDGQAINFSKQESKAAQGRVARDMRKAYPTATVQTGVMSSGSELKNAMDPRMLAEINTILGNAGVDDAVMDMIYTRFLETMPDLSMRKKFLHRKGTAGFHGDALRVFASHMFHASHQMGRLKYGIELQELVNKTKDQARIADDPNKAMMLANSVSDRHKWVMNPTGNKFSQMITSTAFVWFIGTSPASAVLNLTQTVMLGVPILGARYGGAAKAGAAILRASKDFIAGRGAAANANIAEDEKRAMAAFYESGLIDRTQSHDLAGVGETGVEYSPLRARIMGVIGWAFHNAEIVNREVTALAAYRLARQAGQNEMQAIDEAHERVWQIHFDYSNSSRPTVMQNDVAKVALVFKAYNINMLYRVFRDIHQSVKGETAQAKHEARYQLAGVVGMMSLMAGVTGTIGFNLAMAIAGMIIGDDDDPMDFEQQFRSDMIDVLGPELGGVVLNGVPGHYLGIDLNRIGMPDLWFRSSTKDLQGKQEFDEFILNSLGAGVSMGAQIVQGVSLIMDEGKVARGVEVMAPKWARDIMKSYRYANEGVATARGDQIIPAAEMSYRDLIVQALGFTPAKVGETWGRNSSLKNAEQRILDRRKSLMNDFAVAIADKDDQGRKEAIEAIKQFNAVPVNRPLAITAKALKQSLKTRARNAAKRQDGVLIGNEALGKSLRDRLPAPIYR